jgi:hypothetical protein
MPDLLVFRGNCYTIRFEFSSVHDQETSAGMKKFTSTEFFYGRHASGKSRFIFKGAALSVPCLKGSVV